MRGPGLFFGSSIFLLCGACLAQKVQFTPAEKSLVLERMKSIPETNADRAARLKELFIQAGCNGNSLFEQKVEGAETPNIICLLGTGEGDTVIVGGHYERTSSAQRPLDNWSGASILPRSIKACAKESETTVLFLSRLPTTATTRPALSFSPAT